MPDKYKDTALMLQQLLADEAAAQQLERRAVQVAIAFFVILLLFFTVPPAIDTARNTLGVQTPAPGRYSEAPSAQEQYIERLGDYLQETGTRNFPRDAKGNPLYGNGIVRITVAADGHLSNVALVRSSGDSRVDTALEQLVRDAAPFEAFPDELAEETRSVSFTRKFSFRRDVRPTP